MKKIAILTLYYKNANYGGLLQAFALQKTITNIGYNCQQISYDLNSGYCQLEENKIGSFEKIVQMWSRIKNYNWRRYYKTYCARLNEFEKEIPHTRVVTASTIGELTQEYDTFVCGSDQIWNPIGWQPNLFLEFVKDKKKISYAASIARDNLSDSELGYIKKYVSSFSAISVREEASANLLNERMPELKVEVMPDPTMLLLRNQWEEIAITNDKCMKVECAKPYIFAYFLGNDIAQKEKCIKYANEKGFNIYFIPYMNRDTFLWERFHKRMMLNNVGVKEFLYLINNAELVLTDSFHGAVFSSIFRTPFYTLNRFSDSDVCSMNSRIVTLLNKLELTNRYIKDISSISDYRYTEVEEENITRNLEKLRKTGIEFLDEVIKS